MKIKADFNKLTGKKIKPMHGVNNAPLVGRPRNPHVNYFHYLKEAGIPYVRLHDEGGPYGGSVYVDITNIFRDFDADVNDPASYDFAFTDELLEVIQEQGCEVFYRLGETIENYYELKAYRVFAPKDPQKWAEICEHIIRHYNEGWANGYHMGIVHWEIWCEPEGNKEGVGGPLWIGTKEQYFELYEVTSNHLKKCFGDSIKVGGYSTCHFAAEDAIYEDPNREGIKPPYKNNAQYHIQYMHDFFKYISSEEHKSPLDFFSWHTYSWIKRSLDAADYVRDVMNKYGFEDVEDYLTEWNSDFYVNDEKYNPRAASRALSMMLGMQKTTLSLMCYYDARIGSSQYGGLFDGAYRKPTRVYFAFMMFNQAYKLENEVETSSDNENVFVCGATKNDKSVLLISNMGEETLEVDLVITGADLKDAEVLMINDVYIYSPTGIDVSNGKLTLPKETCVEIRL